MIIKRDANNLLRELECILETRLQDQAENGGLDYATAVDMLSVVELVLSKGETQWVYLDEEEAMWLEDIFGSDEE